MVKEYSKISGGTMELAGYSSRICVRYMGNHFPLRWWFNRLSSLTIILGYNQEQWSYLWINRLVVCDQLKCAKFVAPCVVILKCSCFSYWSLGHSRDGRIRLCHSLVLNDHGLEWLGICTLKMWLQYLCWLAHSSNNPRSSSFLKS